MPQCFSMIAGAEPMKHASEQKLMAAASASIRNSRMAQHRDRGRHEIARVERDARLRRMRLRQFPPRAGAQNTTPQTTMTANTARQPNATCTQPPMIGATAGARPKIIVVRFMRRCAAAPSYRSRMMARPMTTPTPAVAPCNTRDAISMLVVRREHAGDRAHGVQRHAPDHDRPPPERIRQRAVHQRGERERHHVRRDHLLELPRVDLRAPSPSRGKRGRTCRWRTGSPSTARRSARRASRSLGACAASANYCAAISGTRPDPGRFPALRPAPSRR